MAVSFRSFLLESNSDGWDLFKAMFDNMTDETRMMIYADWLEEHGFPECAVYMRAMVEPSRPHAYYSKMQMELEGHGIFISEGEVRYKGTRLRISHNSIEVNDKDRWRRVDKAKPNVHDAAPGLAMLLVSQIRKTAPDHETRVLFSFLGNYSVELMRWADITFRAMNYGRDIPQSTLYRIIRICDKIQDLLPRIKTKNLEWGSPYPNMIGSIRARAERLQEMIHESGMETLLTRKAYAALEKLLTTQA